MNLLTAIYVRQSADRADSISLAAQERLCRLDTAPEEPVRVYSDGGFSGKNTERPALQAMLADIRAGKIGRVLVYRLDRISRNLADFTQMLTLFRSAGISFSSRTERFETASPMGQAMQNMLMVFAELERETICARVRDAAFARARAGLDTGRAAPFGFRREAGTVSGRRTAVLVPDVTAQTLRQGFAMYAAGKSLSEICAAWNHAGIRTARGKSWSTGTLSRILRNPVYVQADSAVLTHLSRRGAELCLPEHLPAGHGIYLYADRRISHTRFGSLTGTLAISAPHEGLVPARLWLDCQARLAASVNRRQSGRGKRTWLSGLIYCAACGSAMTVTQGRHAAYLVCGGRKRGKCAGAGAVWRLAEAEALAGELLAERLSELPAPVQRDLQADAAAEREIERLRVRQEELLRLLTDPAGGAAEAIAEAAGRLAVRIRSLEKGTAEQKKSPAPSGNPLPDWNACTDGEKRDIAKILVNGMFTEGETLHIYFA
ncbi:MAG: recombinase family protein [Oscillospiraceae bacterium]|nr:recombinase family protein [Oscillospiraceae bacterium]